MDSNAAQPITVHLPPDILRQVISAAKRRRVTPSTVIAETLGSLMPAENRATARDERSRIQQMRTESREELEKKAAQRLPERAAARLADLLMANGEGCLTPAEEQELDALLDDSERIARESLAARWALKSLDRSNGRDG